jgi:hypothetical protein
MFKNPSPLTCCISNYKYASNLHMSRFVTLALLVIFCNIAHSQSIDSQIREFARSEYPNDIEMQNYIYKQQKTAYEYMRTVDDQDVKEIALREYPKDYSMQKYVYDNQLSAKSYMRGVTDSDVEEIALREYPSDYSMQKYIYDQQISAKRYMQSATNTSAREKSA